MNYKYFSNNEIVGNPYNVYINKNIHLNEMDYRRQDYQKTTQNIYLYTTTELLTIQCLLRSEGKQPFELLCLDIHLQSNWGLYTSWFAFYNILYYLVCNAAVINL